MPAHAFALTRLNGDTLALADLSGQWVVVNFWATWCIPCKAEMPYLQALSERLPAEIVVVGINQREDAALVQSFVTELAIDFPILLNPDDPTLLAYQVTGLPRTAIVDPQGNLYALILGPVEAHPVFAEWVEEIGRLSD